MADQKQDHAIEISSAEMAPVRWHFTSDVAHLPPTQPQAQPAQASAPHDHKDAPGLQRRPSEVAIEKADQVFAGVRFESGLGENEVNKRRAQYGWNAVEEVKPNLLLKFLSKFVGLTAWMLVCAPCVSLVSHQCDCVCRS